MTYRSTKYPTSPCQTLSKEMTMTSMKADSCSGINHQQLDESMILDWRERSHDSIVGNDDHNAGSSTSTSAEKHEQFIITSINDVDDSTEERDLANVAAVDGTGNNAALADVNLLALTRNASETEEEGQALHSSLIKPKMSGRPFLQDSFISVGTGVDDGILDSPSFRRESSGNYPKKQNQRRRRSSQVEALHHQLSMLTNEVAHLKGELTTAQRVQDLMEKENKKLSTENKTCLQDIHEVIDQYKEMENEYNNVLKENKLLVKKLDKVTQERNDALLAAAAAKKAAQQQGQNDSAGKISSQNLRLFLSNSQDTIPPTSLSAGGHYSVAKGESFACSTARCSSSLTLGSFTDNKSVLSVATAPASTHKTESSSDVMETSEESRRLSRRERAEKNNAGRRSRSTGRRLGLGFVINTVGAASTRVVQSFVRRPSDRGDAGLNHRRRTSKECPMEATNKGASSSNKNEDELLAPAPTILRRNRSRSMPSPMDTSKPEASSSSSGISSTCHRVKFTSSTHDFDALIADESDAIICSSESVHEYFASDDIEISNDPAAPEDSTNQVNQESELTHPRDTSIRYLASMDKSISGIGEEPTTKQMDGDRRRHRAPRCSSMDMTATSAAAYRRKRFEEAAMIVEEATEATTMSFSSNNDVSSSEQDSKSVASEGTTGRRRFGSRFRRSQQEISIGEDKNTISRPLSRNQIAGPRRWSVFGFGNGRQPVISPDAVAALDQEKK